MDVGKNGRRTLRKRGIYLLPNLLTTAALFAGFYSVVAAMDGSFGPAAVAIFIAMILDGVDGRVARMTGTDSDFGKEYDSLSDMVSFGLAPALVIYQWGLQRLLPDSIAWGRLGWLAAFCYSVGAALRLARFNSRPAGDKRFFEGLPSPSGAGLVAGWVWLATYLGLQGNAALVPAFIVTGGAGALMVSGFRYYSFKDLNLGERIRFTQVMAIPAVFVLISLNPPVVLFLLFLAYGTSGPLFSLFRFLRRRRRLARGNTPTAQSDADNDAGKLTGTE